MNLTITSLLEKYLQTGVKPQFDPPLLLAIYEGLPEASKCLEADNPWNYVLFFRPGLHNPFIVLCEDQDPERRYTWHIACIDHPDIMWFDKQTDGQYYLESLVSQIRRRQLSFIEIVDRQGNHIFI